MKAIILAAGFGRRLQPLTNIMPKSMVPVGGVPMLIRSMDKIADLGVDGFIIVTGHMASYIEGRIGSKYRDIPVTYVENIKYETTNNIYSLWMALPHIDDDVLLFECDLLYSQQLSGALGRYKADCVIVTSYFDPDTMNGSVIQIEDENTAVDLWLKSEQGDGFDYADKRKTVNIYKFSKAFFKAAMAPALEAEIAAGNVNSYYEYVLKGILESREWDARVLNVPDSWWREVDDMDDLKRAEESDLI